MFKTARLKVHNPSRHKKSMLWYALTHYHLTLKHVLETALADADLPSKIITPEDWRTKEVIEKRAYSGVILPLELGREYHDQRITAAVKISESLR